MTTPKLSAEERARAFIQRECPHGADFSRVYDAVDCDLCVADLILSAEAAARAEAFEEAARLVEDQGHRNGRIVQPYRHLVDAIRARGREGK